MGDVIQLILLVLVAAFIVPQSSRAEERVALVIGNGTYTTISSLRNARSDAALMADTLRKLDFDVVEALDVDRADMAADVRAFGAQLRGAGENAVGLFYYAGHGVQARGVNYMVPVSASIDTESVATPIICSCPSPGRRRCETISSAITASTGSG